jgi:putative nucleotidyltransferase with HDIG domain/PAS domain S-box-containing protein
MTDHLVPGKPIDNFGDRRSKKKWRDTDKKDYENLENIGLTSAINRLFESYQLSRVDHINDGIQLSESQHILLKLFNNLPWMIFRCQNDEQWTIEFVSRGSLRLTGYHPMHLILDRNITMHSLIQSKDWLMVKERIDTALDSKQTFDLVFRIDTKMGDEKWVRGLGYGVYDHDGEISALEGILFDIAGQENVEVQVQQRIQQIQALRKIDLAITSSFDLRVPLAVLLDQVVEQLRIDATDIYLYEENTDQLLFASQRGFDYPDECPKILPRKDSFASEILVDLNTIHIDDISLSSNHYSLTDLMKKERFVTYFGVPLIVKGRVRGILEVYNREMLSPDRDWVEFLEALGAQAAIAVDNKTMFENLERSNQELAQAYDATLEGWSKTLELRDQDTEGHTRRVSELTIQLARALGMGEDNLVHVRRGALLHDIGKVGIPDSILTKPGPLTDAEWEIMRQHPVYAYELLSPVEFLVEALNIPYCHHEHWNGSGYPRGLKGEEIPLEARIFAVVDVWDALLSERPYRKAWSREKAKAYIIEQAGKQFDPVIVKAFIKLISTNE